MNKGQARAGFIFSTIFLDCLGLGFIIPTLPDIIRRFVSDPVTVGTYFGYFISLYALMQFLASPVLGSLSDRFGRRPVLLVSLFGASLDYLLMAFAPNLFLLFIGRLISGLSGASITVASAYMADVSTDKNRSNNFGLIGAAFGVGFIAGPIMGGFLGTISPQAPFLGAAVLNIINFAFGVFVLPESLIPSKRRKLEFKNLNPFRTLLRTFERKNIMALLLMYVCLFLAGQVHPSVWTLYTQTKFGWTAFDVGLSLSFVGISVAIVQGGLIRIIIPKIGESKALLCGAIMAALGYVAFACAQSGWQMYVILFPSAFAGLATPALQAMLTKKVSDSEQGELQGSLTSLTSVTAIMGPIIYTSLFTQFSSHVGKYYFPGAPYLAAAGMCLLCILIFYFSKKPTRLSHP